MDPRRDRQEGHGDAGQRFAKNRLLEKIAIFVLQVNRLEEIC